MAQIRTTYLKILMEQRVDPMANRVPSPTARGAIRAVKLSQLVDRLMDHPTRPTRILATGALKTWKGRWTRVIATTLQTATLDRMTGTSRVMVNLTTTMETKEMEVSRTRFRFLVHPTTRWSLTSLIRLMAHAKAQDPRTMVLRVSHPDQWTQVPTKD